MLSGCIMGKSWARNRNCIVKHVMDYLITIITTLKQPHKIAESYPFSFDHTNSYCVVFNKSLIVLAKGLRSLMNL